MNIKPLTDGLYEAYQGHQPPIVLDGLAVVEGDNVYAVCGTAEIGGIDFIMFGMKVGARKRDIIRGWRIFKDMLSDDKTYYAIIDVDLSTAPALLAHFGFERFNDDTYVLVNK